MRKSIPECASPWVYLLDMGAFSKRPSVDPRAIGAFLVMSALTFASSYATWYYAEREATAEFRSRAALIHEAIHSRVQSYIELLNQSRGLFDVTKPMTREKFHVYSESVKLQENFPGAEGLGFAAKRGNRFPITYLEPEAKVSLSALGFDLFSSPERREAMIRAMRSGAPAATGKLQPIQVRSGRRQSGFLIFLPIYRRGLPAGTPSERERAIAGFVFCAFYSDDFFNSIIRKDIDRDLKMDFEVFAAPRMTNAALLHDHSPVADRTRTNYRLLMPIEIADSTWSLYLHSIPGFRSQFSKAVSWVILCVGMILSVLLSWNFWLIRVRQAGERAQRERLQFLYETTKDLMGPLGDGEDVLARLNSALVHRVADWAVTLALPEVTQNEGSSLRVMARDPWVQEKLEKANLKGFLGLRRAARDGKPDHVEIFDPKTTPSVSGAFEFSLHIPLRSYLCVPLRTANRTLGAVAMGITAGKRKFIAEDLRLVGELANRAALAVENAILYRNSLEAVELRDTFMSIASHELKTPLTSLRLQTQMAQRYLNSAATPLVVGRVEKIVEATDKQVSRLVRLVDDMLDVARIRTGKLQMDFSTFDLSELARETLERLKEQFISANTPLARVELESVQGTWDRFRIEQVMINLLTNAMKYGRARPLEVVVKALPDRAVFTVIDHGIGIPAEALDRIFQRFERAVSSRNISGLGLGLFIVREIIDAHGGLIRVESRPEQGSTFTIELPFDSSRGPRLESIGASREPKP